MPDLPKSLGIVAQPGDRLETFMATQGGLLSGAIFNGPLTHRYALWRVWDDAVKPLVVIGLNPSTADAMLDDPTVRRCKGFARSWGHGGLVMLNLFSYRSTDPTALDHKNRLRITEDQPYAWPESVTGGQKHDAYLKFFTAAERAGAVLAAWGNAGWISGRGAIVEDLLQREGVTLMALGVTKQARPLHPLYVPRSTKPLAYRRGFTDALREALRERGDA